MADMTVRSPRAWMRSPFTSLQSEINRLMDEFTGGSMMRRDWPGMTGTGGVSYVPSLDVSEDAENVFVQTDLPGVKAEDIDVEVDRDRLTISGEKKRMEEKKERDYYQSERMYGRFYRSVRLPTEVDSNDVDARFNDGVLTLKMRKSEPSQSKRIKIRT